MIRLQLRWLFIRMTGRGSKRETDSKTTKKSDFEIQVVYTVYQHFKANVSVRIQSNNKITMSDTRVSL